MEEALSLLTGSDSQWVLIGLVLVVVILRGFFIVLRENERGVVFVLGRYLTTYEPGMRFTVPFLCRVAKVNIREPGQPRGEVVSWSGKEGTILLDGKKRRARAESELTPRAPVIAVERDGIVVAVKPV